MKKINSQDCFDIYCRAMEELNSKSELGEETKKRIKEADKAMREAKKELAALRRSGMKKRLEFFDND